MIGKEMWQFTWPVRCNEVSITFEFLMKSLRLILAEQSVQSQIREIMMPLTVSTPLMPEGTFECALRPLPPSMATSSETSFTAA